MEYLQIVTPALNIRKQQATAPTAFAKPPDIKCKTTF